MNSKKPPLPKSPDKKRLPFFKQQQLSQNKLKTNQPQASSDMVSCELQHEHSVEHLNRLPTEAWISFGRRSIVCLF